MARARTQSATVVFTREPGPTWRLLLEAGPAYSTSRNFDGRIGYTVRANVSKRVREANEFSFYYSHRPADSTGIGSVSDTHSAGAAFSRTFGRRALLNLNLSAYDARGNVATDLQLPGRDGERHARFRPRRALARRLRRQLPDAGNSGPTADLSYERVYAMLRYSLPRLWRGSR